MIAYLSGKLIAKENNVTIIDVNGVGYQVFMSACAFSGLPDVGAPISIDIYTHVKEDEISLYGFYDEVEKNCFKMLLSISGIGPKMAMVVISKISAHHLTKHIENADVAALSSVPGIGKKTAQRIIVGLKGKITNIFRGRGSGEIPSKYAELVRDTTSALVNLGFEELQTPSAFNY